MLEKYSRYRILREFFMYPATSFFMRQLSRNTGISQPSVLHHLKALVKTGLIIRDEQKGLYPSYRAHRDSELFKRYKVSDLLVQFQETGLISSISDQCLPDCIVLFGSASLGEDTEESDIDLFIQSPETKLNLEKFEKIFKRKINLFFEEKFTRLSSELKNNILNGIKLKGYLKVFVSESHKNNS